MTEQGGAAANGKGWLTMENRQETFQYTYSARQQEEIQTIRKKYLPKEQDKMEQLRRLDQKAAKKGTAASVAAGVLGCLLLGVGMCCTMAWTCLLYTSSVRRSLSGPW